MKKFINLAITSVGSQTALANICGVSSTAVRKWLNGGNVNAKYLCAISDATNGEVTVEQLARALDYRNKKKHED